MTEKPSFLERRKAAALEQLRKDNAERRAIASLFISDEQRHAGRQAEQMVKLAEGDWIVGITGMLRATDTDVVWFTVVGGERDTTPFLTQDDALLYLVHRRHNSKPDQGAVFYAGLVLGLPTDTDN